MQDGLMRQFVKQNIEKHQSFFKYTWVGVIVTVLTIVLSSLFIDVFGFSAWIVNTVVIGGFFVLKYFMYKWVGFAR